MYKEKVTKFHLICSKWEPKLGIIYITVVGEC